MIRAMTLILIIFEKKNNNNRFSDGDVPRHAFYSVYISQLISQLLPNLKGQ